MDPEITESFFTAELGKEIAKSFVISAATVVGMMAGFIAVGIVIRKVKAINDKKSEKTPITP